MTLAERSRDSTWNGPLFKTAVFLGIMAFAVLTSRQPMAAVTLAAGLAMVAALMHRLDIIAKLGVFIIVGAVPFEILARTMWNPATTLHKLVFVPAFAVFVATCVVNKKPFVIGRQVWAASTFLGSILLSTALTGGDINANLQTVFTAFGLFLFIVLTNNVLECERDVHQLLWILVLSNVVSASISLGSSLLGFSFLGRQADERLYGVMGIANTVADFALIGLCFVPYLFMTAKQKWNKVALIGSAAVMLLALLHTLSRFAMISLAVCAVYTQLRWRSSIRLSSTLLPLAVVTLLVWPLLPPKLSTRLMTMSNIERIGSDSTFRVRIETIKSGIGMFMESPIWGVGPGQFFSQYKSQKYRYISSKRHFVVHNAFVRVLAEQGLIGLFSFLMLVIFSFLNLRAAIRLCDSEGNPWRKLSPFDVDTKQKTRRRLRLQAASVEIGLLALMVSCLSQPSLYAKYVWLMFALSEVLYRLSRELREDCQTTPAMAVTETVALQKRGLWRQNDARPSDSF